MTRREQQCALSAVLCGVDDITNCPYKGNGKCKLFGLCRIEDKIPDADEARHQTLDNGLGVEHSGDVALIA